MKFTIEEIRNYIKSKDSIGDVLYHLSEANIVEANDGKNQDSLENNKMKVENCEHWCHGNCDCIGNYCLSE